MQHLYQTPITTFTSKPAAVIENETTMAEIQTTEIIILHSIEPQQQKSPTFQNHQAMAPQSSSINQPQQVATTSLQPPSFDNHTFQNTIVTSDRKKKLVQQLGQYRLSG